jgi:hypothetical protein
LRFTLGGKRPTTWDGQIRLVGPVDGQWQDLHLLSIEPAAIGSVHLSADRQSLLISQPESLDYGSFQVDCLAAPEAQLEIQLRSRTEPQLSYYQLVELKQVIDSSWSLGLGAGGNGLWIERPREDQIRVKTTAFGDVIPVGQSFEVTWSPNLPAVARGTTLRYVVKLAELTSGYRSIREELGELKPTDRGDFPPPPAWPLIAGPTPGVYQIQIELYAAKSSFNLLAGVSQSPAPLATRRLQWVAVDPLPDTEPVKSVAQDLSTGADLLRDGWSGPRFVERLRIEPQDLTAGGVRGLDLPRLPWLNRWQPQLRAGASDYLTKSSESLRVSEREGRSVWELGPNQWRTIELPPLDRGHYLIEIPWLEEGDVSLGLDVVQADPLGRVPHWTTSSQLIRADHLILPGLPTPTDPASPWRSWQTLHWLNNDDPKRPTQVVLSNGSSTQGITLSGLRILQSDAAEAPLTTERRRAGRSVGLLLDTPLITSLFSGRKSAESADAPALNDWVAYHDAVERIGQYLSAKNYNTIWLPVYKQGGALFPTAPFSSTARFENSVFGTLSQAGPRMDVVQLLLHELSLRQVSVVPILDFSVPPQSMDSARSGKPEPAVPSPAVANPLDPAFQTQLLNFVTMFAQRYRHYPALAGVAIELSPDSPLLFPSESAGLSPTVVARFLDSQSLVWPLADLGPIAACSPENLATWVLREHRDRWLLWRAAELTGLLDRLQGPLQAAAGERGGQRLRLHLVLSNLHRQPLIEHSLYPSLRVRPNWDENWLRLGLDLSRFADPDSPAIVIQQAASRGKDMAANRRVQEAIWAPEFWQSLSQLPQVGQATQKNTQQFALEALQDLATDYPGQMPQTFQVVEAKSGHEAVWAETLRRHDCRQLLSQAGGLPRTLHPNEQPFARAFAGLRDETFETLYQEAGAPVAIRQSIIANGRPAQCYLVNAAAWPVTCRLQFESPVGTDLSWQDLSSGSVIQARPVAETDARPRSNPPTSVNSTTYQVVIPLAPHSLTVLAGPRLPPPRVTITEGPTEAYDRLQAVKESLFRRLRQVASNALPLPALQNPGFDSTSDPSPRIPNWTHGQLSNGQSLELDRTNYHDGVASLRIANAGGVLWLRSSPLPPPVTGRLSVTAWIKNSREQPADSIRLSLDGQSSSGAKYYRFAEINLSPVVMASNQALAEPDGWQPVAVHFDDLPEEDLVSIRIGVDMMEPGQLWLDSIQCFDRWLDANEQKVLSNRLGLAAFSLDSKQNFFAAFQALDDYWLRFLLTHIPDPNLGLASDRPATDIPAADSRPKNARGRRFLPLR